MTIPNGYRVEQSGEGTPLYCWHGENANAKTELTFDGIEFGFVCSDHDYGFVEFELGAGVFVELLRRAGFTVNEPTMGE